MNDREWLNYIHNFDNVLLIWWYNTKSHKLSFFKDADGHGDKRFIEFLGKDTNYLEKGRLIKYQGKNVLVIYSSGMEDTTMNSDDLNDLIRLIESETGLNIDKIINHRGVELVVENKIISTILSGL